MQKIFFLAFASLLTFSYQSCDNAKSVLDKAGESLDNVNLFTYKDDIELGNQLKEEISNDPKNYPVLPESGNKEIYNYMRSLMNVVLSSDKVKHKNEFQWNINIIKEDKTINAFAAPGGQIYVYTGLIKFLESEDQMLSVIAHEIAHADLRHATRQLTKNMGIAILLNAVLGEKQSIQQIAGALVNLRFSRSNEFEADENAVLYLCSTDYNPTGSIAFFDKMKGQPSPPEFLNTHPSPENRIQKINEKKNSLACSGTKTNASKFAQMKKLI
jgi:predicted Zn-dependent protease